MQQFLLIFVGGGLGAAGRHYVSAFALRQFGPAFPYGTLAVNVAGSLVMGLFIGWLVQRGGDISLRLFFATGVLGGFTTFSAFSLDFANLWQRGEMVAASLYVLSSVGASLVAVFVGLALARIAFAA
ncbi:MAG: fluoride efflux transporter CrcB [Ahrensia sp.]|nr:fluoride efflux transporter CrcB [Ahrensia sp.]